MIISVPPTIGKALPRAAMSFRGPSSRFTSDSTTAM